MSTMRCACLILILYMPLAKLYNMDLKKLESCKNPEPPYAKNIVILLNTTVHIRNNKKYLKGNMTILENLKGYNWRFKEGTVKSGIVKYAHDFKKLGCKSVIPKVLLAVTKVKYNSNSCEIFKGKYNFDFDFGILQQTTVYFRMKDLGEQVWVISFYGPRGTNFCYNLYVEYNVSQM